MKNKIMTFIESVLIGAGFTVGVSVVAWIINLLS
jgi:hypothetical protein